MSDLKDTLRTLLPKLGERGLEEAEKALENLSGKADEPWKKATLGLLADSIDKYGMHGIGMAQNVLETLMRDAKPDLSFMDLETASDVLAHLQNAEADRKKAARDFLLKVGKDLGVFLSAVIKGLVASAV